jgi:soluble lytic murein transglycosylase-like protein
VVRAVVQQESSGNTREVSAAGAQGLMQLMPETGKMYGVTDPFDPEQNIAAGTRHLSNLMREFKNDLPTALAAYNAGSGAIRKAGGIPNYPETKDYIRKITDMVERVKNARDGF